MFLFLAFCLVLLSLATVFVFSASSEGYSCGRLLATTEMGAQDSYGGGGCALQFRQMWVGALLFMGMALVFSTAGAAIVAATSPKRRQQPSMSENV